mmetsp:Transcript_33268/g.105210  ORF Transcript_33268/g.105210 Transcript_33268/m.105210 type:complete len:114 (-) Transcript_33268:1684-2025(-)
MSSRNRGTTASATVAAKWPPLNDALERLENPLVLAYTAGQVSNTTTLAKMFEILRGTVESLSTQVEKMEGEVAELRAQAASPEDATAAPAGGDAEGGYPTKTFEFNCALQKVM